VHRPRCYLAGFDPAAGAYVVLLEDLAPAEAGDQIAGCSPEDAAAAVAELAALHASRWGDPALLDLAWLDRPSPEAAAATAQVVTTLFAGFVDRYRDRLAPGVLTLAEILMTSLEGYLAGRPGPWSVLHGDYRLDNLLFGGPRVAVVDWQTVRAGPPLCDLSYFVGSALQPEARREREAGLVDAYRQALGEAGVVVGRSECWEGYRRFCFDGLIMAVAASMLVARTDRSDDMFMAMANRHGLQALDLGSAEFLAAPSWDGS
jgi:aminoglycoside/choline kinase family phosphotransferase